MADDKNGFLSQILKIVAEEIKYSDRYGFQYFEANTFNKISGLLSQMRRLKLISGEDYHTIFRIYREYYRNSIKNKDLIAKEPRYIAQQFIGKKEIRKIIFERDKVCLRCGTKDSLSIDHVIPVNKNGPNEIGNLQTLCVSCNSWKSDRIIDYRIKA